ncbi:MAG: hypothetical protein JG766_2747 [Desulfacinum sp.]|jgi:hypothetical protein|nr:hypothetical protein [Desulfacinum sp.]
MRLRFTIDPPDPIGLHQRPEGDERWQVVSMTGPARTGPVTNGLHRRGGTP